MVSSSWDTINGDLESANPANPDQDLTSGDLDDATTQLRRDFGTGPLQLAPRSADWVGLNPGFYSVGTVLPILKGIPAKIEVAYRYPLASDLRLVAGSMPGTNPQAANGLQVLTNIQVVVTAQTAKVFALQPGSALVTAGPASLLSGGQPVPAPPRSHRDRRARLIRVPRSGAPILSSRRPPCFAA